MSHVFFYIWLWGHCDSYGFWQGEFWALPLNVFVKKKKEFPPAPKVVRGDVDAPVPEYGFDEDVC